MKHEPRRRWIQLFDNDTGLSITRLHLGRLQNWRRWRPIVQPRTSGHERRFAVDFFKLFIDATLVQQERLHTKVDVTSGSRVLPRQLDLIEQLFRLPSCIAFEPKFGRIVAGPQMAAF